MNADEFGKFIEKSGWQFAREGKGSHKITSMKTLNILSQSHFMGKKI